MLYTGICFILQEVGRRGAGEGGREKSNLIGLKSGIVGVALSLKVILILFGW